MVPDNLLMNEGALTCTQMKEFWFLVVFFRRLLVLDVLNSSLLKFLCRESEPRSGLFLQALLKKMPRRGASSFVWGDRLATTTLTITFCVESFCPSSQMLLSKEMGK